MKRENILKSRKRGRKTYKFVSIRVSPQVKTWLEKKNYSATGIFMESIRDLGYKD